MSDRLLEEIQNYNPDNNAEENVLKKIIDLYNLHAPHNNYFKGDDKEHHTIKEKKLMFSMQILTYNLSKEEMEIACNILELPEEAAITSTVKGISIVYSPLTTHHVGSNKPVV